MKILMYNKAAHTLYQAQQFDKKRNDMKPATQFITLSAVIMFALFPSTARAAETLYPDTVNPAARPSDKSNGELGTIFHATLAGAITQVRVFSLIEESGDHQVRIWRNADNTMIAGPITWTFGGDEAWITLDIPDVSIQANQDYTISISAPDAGWYPANAAYFSSAGNNGENLAYPQGAGVFSDTSGNRPTNSFNSTAYLRDIVFEPDLSGTVMRVDGNGIAIDDGASIPSLANGTDLGGKGLNSGSRDQTYTISNIGQTSLQLTGNPAVVISGAQASDFVVTSQPAATVLGGSNTTFTVRFDPSAIGIRKATVTIAHADSTTNAYDFAIQGAGLGGGAGVIGNDGDGTFARNIDDSQIQGNRFQAPVDMRITNLQARVLDLVGTFKCAVYSDTNGVADRLLRSSVEVVNATNGWNTFALTSPLDLTAGDSYWLVIWSDTLGARVQADPVGTAYVGTYSYVDLGGQWPDPVSLTASQGEARTYCIYAEGTPLSTVPGPEIDLKGNGKLIISGDSSPSVLDGTDFGNLSVSGGTQDRTFTIFNPGDTPLVLAGNPSVTISGPQASDFVVTSPPASPVAPGSNATFTVRFDPAARGFRAATVSIANNDADENPFQFAVQGAGFITGRESLWPDTKVGKDFALDGTYYELGMIFRSSVAGKITQLRVFSVASETGDHTARLWRNDDDTVIGGPYTWNYGGVTGWITFDIPPVDIVADTDYTVSISTGTSPKRNYPNVPDFATAGNNGGHLSYPVDAGVFTTQRDARPTQSFNHGDYFRDIVFIPAGATVDLPDVDVKGNNTSIADGDSSPSSTDGTDFGQTTVGGGTVDRTFTLANTGAAPLNLSGTPKVAITGPQASDFTVITQPAATIPLGGNSTFTIRFAPAAAGVRSATVSIQNDSDKNPFDFAIAGTGAAVTAQLSLAVVHSQSNVILSWPAAGSAGYILEFSNILPNSNWLPEPTTPVVVAGQNTVTVPITTSTRFYRLRLP